MSQNPEPHGYCPSDSGIGSPERERQDIGWVDNIASGNSKSSAEGSSNYGDRQVSQGCSSIGFKAVGGDDLSKFIGFREVLVLKSKRFSIQSLSSYAK